MLISLRGRRLLTQAGLVLVLALTAYAVLAAL